MSGRVLRWVALAVVTGAIVFAVVLGGMKLGADRGDAMQKRKVPLRKIDVSRLGIRPIWRCGTTPTASGRSSIRN